MFFTIDHRLFLSLNLGPFFSANVDYHIYDQMMIIAGTKVSFGKTHNSPSLMFATFHLLPHHRHLEMGGVGLE